VHIKLIEYVSNYLIRNKKPFYSEYFNLCYTENIMYLINFKVQKNFKTFIFYFIALEIKTVTSDPSKKNFKL